VPVHAILLVSISAVFHVAWNAIIKRTGRTAEMMFLALAWIALVAAVPFAVVVSRVGLAALPWKVLIVSGCFIGAYTRSLTAAYEAGDLTIVYPLARSAPIYVVLAAYLFLGESVSSQGLLGILLAVAGCALLPMRHGLFRERNIHWRHYINLATMLALVTALCTTGYSILDKVGMMRMKSFGLAGAFVYIYAEFTVSFVVYGLLLLTGRRRPVWSTFRRYPLTSLGVAVLNLAGYLLVLAALQVAQANYVVAFRQLSVALSVPVGILVLGERDHWRYRAAGALVIAVGLVLIGLA